MARNMEPFRRNGVAMTDPDLPPSTPPPTVPPPTPPTTPPTNPPPGPGAPQEPPPLTDGPPPGGYVAPGAAAYGAPSTGPSPGSPYASGQSAGYPYATGAPTPPQTLSLTSFIVGLASLVFCWVPGLGFLAAIAAVIIGFIARRRELAAPKWMWLVGIISGFAAILLSLLFLIPFLLLVAFGSAITSNLPVPSA
jgi:hypothetical protein